MRRQHLSKEPVCQGCGIDLDLEVHHILPFHIDATHELDPDNLITLCEHPGHDCHFGLGHAWDWRSYVPTVRDDVKYVEARKILR